MTKKIKLRHIVTALIIFEILLMYSIPIDEVPIRSESEVLKINDVSAGLDAETRKFTYSASLKTIYGPTEVTF